MAQDISCMIDALKDAVQMEIDGQKFYQQAAKQAKTPGTREIFEYLAKSEEYHIQKIREIYQALEKDPKWSETMCTFEQPHHDPNVFGKALAKETMGQGNADDLKALKLGMDMEEQSVAYYNKLAREAATPMERRFFLSLVNEERGHYLALLDYHNYLADPADWFFVSEMAHVDGA
ncbi:MAG: ferritin family protein [Deltaproteobacteria bacterium]|nr:ferritin family protein [Deltaproteobacteria bacterium]